jgi:ribosomal protein L11 methyltransferase
MIEGMRAIDFNKRNVLDFGTGTGILAILAKKLGAASVTAIDNDEWSVTNATENASMNNEEIILSQASLEEIAATQYDIVLANINRNILLEHMRAMSNQLTTSGILLLSGILKQDEEAIVKAALNEGLSLPHAQAKNGWMAIRFIKA